MASFYLVDIQAEKHLTLAYFRPNDLAIIKYMPIFVV